MWVLYFFGIGVLVQSVVLSFFVTKTAIFTKTSSLHLFDFFKSNKSTSLDKSLPSAPRAKVDTMKVNELKGKLEKISNTQKRDYNAEAIANAPRPKELPDKQVLSYNYKKPNEFPNLFKGWLKKDGDQIAKQIVSATKESLKKGEKLIEIVFDPVPNLDEVAFGTVWNKAFRQDVMSSLQVPEYATNRGGPATLEWSNIYWANRLAEGLGMKNIYAISLSGEGLKGPNIPKLKNNMQLITMADIKRDIEKIRTEGKPSMIIIISPCTEQHYQDAKSIAEKLNGIPVVALNAPFSYKYDIGGGKPYTLSYVMKRIPKGWVFRLYPKPFEIIIEGPEYEIFKAGSFDVQPSLQTISKMSMSASVEKYGKLGNDRIFEQRL